MRDDGADKYEAISAARRAVRDVAAGKSRDEVRALYLAERRARGLPRPPDDHLEMTVTLIINALRRQTARGHAARRRQSARPGLLTSLRIFVKIIRNARIFRESLPQYQPGPRFTFISPDRSVEPIQVALEPGPAQWLAAGRHMPRRADPATRIDVWLDFAEAAHGDRLVRVHLRNHIVGVLPPEDGTLFWSEIEDAQRDGGFLMTSGFIAGRDASSIRFYVYRFAADD
jgi:hypothetical protein